MFTRILVLVFLAWLLGLSPAAAEGATGGMGGMGGADAEGFLRAQLLAGRLVDFNERCRSTFEPLRVDLARIDGCRVISGSALTALIEDKDINNALSPRGMFLIGLVVKGPVNLHWADIRANLICRYCLFDSRIDLEEATVEHDLRFEGVRLLAGLAASASQIKGRFSFIDHTTVSGGKVDLAFAKVADALETDAAVFGAGSALDIEDATISHIALHASRFEAGIDARDAEVNGSVVIDGGTAISGMGLVARGLIVDSFFRIGDHVDIDTLILSSSHLKSNIALDDHVHVGARGLRIANATLDGELLLLDSTIDGDFIVSGSTIARGLRTDRMVYKGKFALSRAAVGGDLAVDASAISVFVAQKLHVGGSLYIKHVQIEDSGLDLKGGGVAADVEIYHTRINGDLELNQVAIGKQLDIENDTRVAGEARLIGTTVGGDLLIGNDTSRQSQPVRFNKAIFDLSVVSSSVFMHNVVFQVAPQLVGTEIKGHFDISAARLPGLDMTRALVRGDFRVAAREAPHRVVEWSPHASLVLNNAHVGVVQDENEGPHGDPWPEAVDLESFAFDHFGHDPPVAWVRTEWLDRSSFQPAAYVGLAKYYADDGQKEQSDRVLYAEKTRETIDAWHGCGQANVSACARAVRLSVLRVLIGYGIGNGLFLALVWVVVLTLVGAFVLRSTRNGGARELWGGKDRGRMWCVGASINQLLPIVELNREFKDYFEDPERKRFDDWQLIYFAIHAVMGYVLASFVVAAIAGLTQTH